MSIIREPASQPRVTRHHAPAHTPVRNPVHRSVHRPQPHASLPPEPEPRVDIYKPRLNIHIDTMFWQHRSIFAGTQEQLDELRRDADRRAADRARAEFAAHLAHLRVEAERATLETHRPVFKRLKPIVLVGLVPMLWAITTCRCGQRWPCNDIKLYLRRRIGWNGGIDEPLKELTAELPKPANRWTKLKRLFTRRTNRDT